MIKYNCKEPFPNALVVLKKKEGRILKQFPAFFRKRQKKKKSCAYMLVRKREFRTKVKQTRDKKRG